MPEATKDDVVWFQKQIGRLREEIAKVIVGNREIVDGALTCLLTSSHALLEGVPGLGKTLLVRTLAETLSLGFSRIQFTPDLMPADILGTTMIEEDQHGRKTFEFRRGPIFANVVLADEINRATPKTQSALLEAMQEHSVTVSRQTHKLDEPFLVLATQNPLESEGTYPLPEAQLDRFLFKLNVPFPGRDELHAILDRTTGEAQPKVTAVLAKEEILRMQRIVREVPAAKHVADYAVRLLQATHPNGPDATDLVKRFVRFGSSPRGAQAVLLAAKIRALFDGRFAASVEDVRVSALPALRHRVLLNFEGEAEGIKTDEVISDILKRLPEGKALFDMRLLDFFKPKPGPRSLRPQANEDLFDDDFQRKLDYLAIVSRKVFSGRTRAERRTKKSGSGIEFVDHRDYVPGDDLRYLDWNVYQRFGRLQIRLFEEEEDLSVYVIVDTSTSMGFGDGAKLVQAKRLAAALAHVALANLDRVAVVAANETLVDRMPPTRGKQRIFKVFEFLRDLSPQGTTNLHDAVKSFAAQNKRRGIAVLASDLFDPRGFEQGINVLRYNKFEPIVLHVTDERESKPKLLGDIRVYDCETGEEREVTVTPRLLERYREEYRKYLADVERFCTSKQVPYFRADVDVPFDETVLRVFRRGGFLR